MPQSPAKWQARQILVQWYPACLDEYPAVSSKDVALSMCVLVALEDEVGWE